MLNYYKKIFKIRKIIVFLENLKQDSVYNLQGTDITEQFETHHLTNKAEKYLSTFYVREASKPRNYLFTYKENGFYRTLKRRVAATLDGLDQTPITISKVIL